MLLFGRATTFVVATGGTNFLLGHTKYNIALLRLSLSSLRVRSCLTLTARTPCPCARHEDIWGRGGIVLLILNLGTRSRRLFSLTPRPLPPPPHPGKEPKYKLNRRLGGAQSLPGSFGVGGGGEREIFFPVGSRTRISQSFILKPDYCTDWASWLVQTRYRMWRRNIVLTVPLLWHLFRVWAKTLKTTHLATVSRR